MNANQDNFYILTSANFKRHTKPQRQPDHVSDSGSRYWYTKTGVIRSADHWNTNINTCEWNHPDTEGDRTGFADGLILSTTAKTYSYMFSILKSLTSGNMNR